MADAKSAQKTHRLLSAAATTNATVVKAANGTVCHIQGYNNKAAAAFLKMYDKATTPNVGADTPRKTYRLNPTAAFDFATDDYYGAGISYAITGAAADNDTTALVAGDVVCLNIDYQ
jgi:hypothetical protein